MMSARKGSGKVPRLEDAWEDFYEGIISKRRPRGTWVAQSVKCLPSAQVMIPGCWDQTPCWAVCSVKSLFLPLPPPATLCYVCVCVCVFMCVSQVNK